MKQILTKVFAIAFTSILAFSFSMSAYAYTVQKDDTLGQIASKYNVSVKDILNCNDIQDKDQIFPGQEINIPNEVTSQGNTALTSEEIQILHNMFNAEYYAEKNPDVVNKIGNNEVALFDHFCKYGLFELRQLNKDFNVTAYATAYKDLSKTFATDVILYYKHFYQYGKKEQRPLTTMEALAATGIDTKLLEQQQCTITDKNGRPQFKQFYAAENKTFVIPAKTALTSSNKHSSHSSKKPEKPDSDCKHSFKSDSDQHVCEKCGKKESHTFEQLSSEADSDFYINHICICGLEKPHEWENGKCSVCNLVCKHVDQAAGTECQYCHQKVPCETHDWSNKDGKCTVCEITCPDCNGDGTDAGCSTCGKRKLVDTETAMWLERLDELIFVYNGLDEIGKLDEFPAYRDAYVSAENPSIDAIKDWFGIRENNYEAIRDASKDDVKYNSYSNGIFGYYEDIAERPLMDSFIEIASSTSTTQLKELLLQSSFTEFYEYGLTLDEQTSLDDAFSGLAQILSQEVLAYCCG